MSWRQIHSSVATSESLSSISSDAERLFWRVLAQTDAWGRLDGRPAKVLARCCPMIPWTTSTVENLLVELEVAGRIVRYDTACQVLDFDQHQPYSSRRRGFSLFPEAPGVRGSAPDNSGSTQESAGVLLPKGGGKEGEGEVEGKEKTSEANASAELALVAAPIESTQTLVAEYIDAAKTKGVDVPRRVIGQLARNIKELLDEGQPYDRVQAGLRRMAERGVVIPSSLGNFVLEAALPAPRKGTRVSPSEIMAHALQLEREGL